MEPKFSPGKVSDASSSFDPMEWAEKRKLAMAKASEVREQRRLKAATLRKHASSRDGSVDRVGAVVGSTAEGKQIKSGRHEAEVAGGSSSVNRAESRDSVSTVVLEGEKDEWKWTQKPPPPATSTRRATTTPPAMAVSRSGRQLAPATKPVKPPTSAASSSSHRSVKEIFSTTAPAVTRSTRAAIPSPASSGSVGARSSGSVVTRIPASVRPSSVAPTASAATRAVPRRTTPTMTRAPVVAAKAATPRAPLRTMASREKPPSTGVAESSKSADPETRQMIDRDTLRLRSAAMFTAAIAYYRSKHLSLPIPSTPRLTDRVEVYIRKRPLFPKESALREFDVLTVQPSTAVGHPPPSIVLHNCLFQADLKTPYITHSRFVYTGCFGAESTNEEVYHGTAHALVEEVLQGGIGTLFCFGQTGSGKSFTMSALQQFVVQALFAAGVTEVKVEFLELCGKKVFDLLPRHDNGEAAEKPVIKLRESGNGHLLLEGASSTTALDSDTLLDVINRSLLRRNTESTGANDVSSRSHAVCILSLPGCGGKLTLVDLAGSERRKDSMWHDKDRQKEGAEINASLHALKECMRHALGGGGGVIPFRLSTLTRVLADSFVNPKSKLVVIATVSPCATDIEHTLSTLRTVHGLIPSLPPVQERKQTEMAPPAKAGGGISVHPKKWTPPQVQAWLARELGAGADSASALSRSTTGAMLVRMSETRFVQICNGDSQKGNRLYNALRSLMIDQPSFGPTSIGRST